MKLRNGNVHSADGTLKMLAPIAKRHPDRFKRFWLRADAAFGKPEIYEYCEENRITYFIRFTSNNSLTDLIHPHLRRPVGRPPKCGIQTKLIDFYYQAGSWDRPRRVICRIEWHEGELFPRIGFIIHGEGVRRSIEWLILRLIKVGATVSYHARKWHVHVSTAFPLAHHYQEVFDSG